jgi:hypothetical protein
MQGDSDTNSFIVGAGPAAEAGRATRQAVEHLPLLTDDSGRSTKPILSFF